MQGDFLAPIRSGSLGAAASLMVWELRPLVRPAAGWPWSGCRWGWVAGSPLWPSATVLEPHVVAANGRE